MSHLLSVAAGGRSGLLCSCACPGCQRISGLSAAERLTLIWIAVDEELCATLTGPNGGHGKAVGEDTGWLYSLCIWGGLNQMGQWFGVGGNSFSLSKDYWIKMILPFLPLCFRSGKRIKKTRKYDIITTPAERVEMAPLNEEDDEDEDSTVFDVKYRYCCEPIQLGLPTEFLLVKTALFFSAGPAWQRWGSRSLPFTSPKHDHCPLQLLCLFSAHIAL